MEEEEKEEGDEEEEEKEANSSHSWAGCGLPYGLGSSVVNSGRITGVWGFPGSGVAWSDVTSFVLSRP